MQIAGRKIYIGAKAIDEYLGIGNVPKTRRLLRQRLIPGADKLGRQDALDEEVHVELMRSRAGLHNKGAA